ncbi:hypothetical protein L6R52_30405, partial [Myxococcota bacterium]|nr:hypothetical protein [Myxococcota bacterium]
PDAAAPDASAPDASTDAGTIADAGASGTVVILAGGPSGLIGAHLSSGTGWITNALADATNNSPALAATSNGATGLVRSTSNGGELRATVFAAGTFSAPSALGPGITSREAPAGAGSASAASFVFHGDDYRYYFAERTAAWAPTAEPVIPMSGVPSFGPNPASITALGADVVAAFPGGDGDLYDQRRSNGVWLDAHAHGLGSAITLAPSIVALTAGSDLMIAFVRSTDARIVFTTRTGNTWSAPAPIDANAFTNDPVALTALPGGDALLAYRGQDGMLYWSRFTGGAWSVPAGLVAPNVATPARPAVATGVHGFVAEVAFVGADGAVHHSRLSGSTWSAPVSVGGAALVGAAIATLP